MNGATAERRSPMLDTALVCTCDYRIAPEPCGACQAWLAAHPTHKKARPRKARRSALDPYGHAVGRALQRGATYRQIAQKYRVSPACVRGFAKRKGLAPADMNTRWRHA
jgi:hypothetical protein